MLFVKVKSIYDWQYGQGKKIAPHIFEDGYIRHFFCVDSLKAVLEKFYLIRITETKDSYEGRAHGFVEAMVSKM